MTMNTDRFQRFLFEELGVRGELVRLDASWQAVLERHPYPPAVRSQLGQALAATVLLSATIKFEGSLILQIQGRGPLSALVAQATHRRTIRGLAHWRGEVPIGPLPRVFGDGRLVLTIQREGQDPYQGIVALEGDQLASALQRYFFQSEQLPTRLWLVADGARAAGLLLQKLPGAEPLEEDWGRLVFLADTIREGELLRLPFEDLLYRLFHEETVRLFEPEPVTFRCGCSRQRIETMLLALGRREVENILAEQKAVEVDCEFCNKHYRFDAVDVGMLFADDFRAPVSPTQH